MEHSPQVSIIMPVYNSAGYLGEAIQSVIAQTYINWELLIVDDGSTDKPEDILSSMKDPRIHFSKQAHQGVSAARNFAMSKMKGRFFCFLDADDILPSESLQSRVELLLLSPDTMFADGKVKVLNENMSVVISEYLPSFSGFPRKELLELKDNCYFGNTWMIRRLDGVIYRFEEGVTHAEDLIFYLSLPEGKYSFVKQTILYCRKRKDQP